MPDLDLTDATEMAAQAAWESVPQRRLWISLDPVTQHNVRENVLPAVEAAAPLIAAKVRAHIAADIEAERPSEPFVLFDRTRDDAYVHAARIARGDS